MAIAHPTPVWSVLALGGITALLVPAFAPQLLPPPALQALGKLGGSAALRPIGYAAIAVHLVECGVVCYKGVQSSCSARVTAWFMLLALVYGYPGWQPMVAQLQAQDKQDK